LDEARDVFGKLLLILNLDGQIPGIRQYVLQRRGIFKTMVSRRGDYTFTAEAKAEIEHRLEVLRPYMRD
jgi:hypothetical protein